MKYYFFLIISIIILQIGCQPKKTIIINWEPLLNEAFKQAITNKNLTEVDEFLKMDSIYVFPQKAFTSNILVYDSSLAKDLHKLEGIFNLIIVDSNMILTESSKKHFTFIMVSRSNIQNECIIQFSKENLFPEQDEYTMIDKSILKVIFKCEDNKWEVEKVLKYYG